MKNKYVLAILAMALLSSTAFAAIEVQEDGVREGNVSAINISTGLSGSKSGGTYTISTASTDACVAITAGATPTLTVGSSCYTDTIVTDNQDQTITFSSGGVRGAQMRIMFITDTGGSADEVITFEGTLANSAGTLTLANLTAGRYVVTFVSDGTVWNEVSRTGALA